MGEGHRSVFALGIGRFGEHDCQLAFDGAVEAEDGDWFIAGWHDDRNEVAVDLLFVRRTDQELFENQELQLGAGFDHRNLANHRTQRRHTVAGVDQEDRDLFGQLSGEGSGGRGAGPEGVG